MRIVDIIDNCIFLLSKLKIYYANQEQLTDEEQKDFKLLKSSVMYFIKELLKLLNKISYSLVKRYNIFVPL